MSAEVVNLEQRLADLGKRRAARRHRHVEYRRQDWEEIEDHLWRAQIELQRACALLYASRRDK